MELSVWPKTTWASLTEGPKLVAFLHFFASQFQREFSRLFSRDSRLLQRGGKARVDRGIFRLQSQHHDLVYNIAGCLAAGSKVGLFHLFPALIGCFTARFRRLQPSLEVNLDWVVSAVLRKI